MQHEQGQAGPAVQQPAAEVLHGVAAPVPTGRSCGAERGVRNEGAGLDRRGDRGGSPSGPLQKRQIARTAVEVQVDEADTGKPVVQLHPAHFSEVLGTAVVQPERGLGASVLEERTADAANPS